MQFPVPDVLLSASLGQLIRKKKNCWHVFRGIQASLIQHTRDGTMASSSAAGIRDRGAIA